METATKENVQPKLRYIEREQDLFKVGKEYVLAHCVSNDCKLGAGVAKEFRRLIPEMPDVLKSKNPKTGDVIGFKTRGGRIVANLFTKEKYYDKPTLHSLTTSLYVLRRTIREHGYTHIAMPTIGCGLDKLDWNEVSEMIQYVFKEDDIEILICIKKE